MWVLDWALEHPGQASGIQLHWFAWEWEPLWQNAYVSLEFLRAPKVSWLFWESKNVYVQPQVNSQTNTVDTYICLTD